MYVALYDEERRLINYPFYVDAGTTLRTGPTRSAWLPSDDRQAKGATGYILRTGNVHSRRSD